MNHQKQNTHFSFFQGLCSVFFGTRKSRIRIYYSTLNKRSDSEALRSDFENVGNDMRKVMHKHAKEHSLELQECE